MPDQQERTKKIVIAATIAGSLLLLFLLIVIICQLVQIGVRRAEVDKMNEEVEALEQLIADGENKYEYYKTKEYLEQLAYEYGFRFPSDK